MLILNQVYEKWHNIKFKWQKLFQDFFYVMNLEF